MLHRYNPTGQPFSIRFRTAFAGSLLSLAVFLPGLAFGQAAKETDYVIKETETGATVTQGGEVVTEFYKQHVSRPILWPVHGPGKTEMTRAYPMREGDPNEKTDHIHHRSLWVGHPINGIDFWAETTKRVGSVKVVKFERIESGAQGVIEVACDWVGPDGVKELEDHRRYTFSGPPNRRVIDFDVTIIASEKPLHFEDTKEGTVALRVAEWMKVDAKKGGAIVNAEGLKDADAWGKRSQWVDYTGVSPEGKEVGIAFLNHPQSFGYPTRWHVRTYGLFAANPIGVFDFEKLKEPTAGVHLEKGKSMQLFHRIVLHEGRTNQEQINEWYKQYSAKKIAAP